MTTKIKVTIFREFERLTDRVEKCINLCKRSKSLAKIDGYYFAARAYISKFEYAMLRDKEIMEDNESVTAYSHMLDSLREIAKEKYEARRNSR